MPQGKQAKNEDRKPTERVVLEKVSVVVIPPEFKGKPPGDLPAELFAEPFEAWIERAVLEGTMLRAIESYAGKPGEPDAKVGTFKAVPARSWRGGVRHSQPPLPKVEREMIDE